MGDTYRQVEVCAFRWATYLVLSRHEIRLTELKGRKIFAAGNLLPMARWQYFSRHWFPGKCLYDLWIAALSESGSVNLLGRALPVDPH